MASLNANESSFLELMGKSEEHARHGFDLLLKRQDFLKFFDPLVDAGLFTAERNPGPVPVPNENAVRIPFWTALDYLVACAKLSGETNDTALAEKIMAIVRSVSGAAQPGAGQDNFHTFRKFAEILGLLPTTSISPTDLEHVHTWLRTKFDHDMVANALSDGAIPRFLASAEPADWQKAVQLVGYCTEIRWQPSRLLSDTEEPVTVVEEYWLEDLLSKHASALGTKAGPEAALLFQGRVSEVFGRGGRAEWSHVFRPAVGEGQTHHGRAAENCVVEGLRDVLLAWCAVDAEKARAFVEDLLRDDNAMLRRIALYMIGERWDVLKALYLPAVRPELFDAEHLHELHGLLRKHFESFGENEKAATLDAILRLPTSDDEDGVERVEHLRLRWLSAIAETTYPPAAALLKELNAKYGGPPKRPNYLSYIEVGSGPGPSQYSANELVALAESGAVVQKLKAFTPSNTWDGPTTDALVDQLQIAVRSSPSVFLRVLPGFLAAPIHFQYGVINGFLRLWREPDSERPFAEWEKGWPRLFDFFTALLSDPAFWTATDSERRREVTPMWIVEAIADLLQGGTRDDARAYPPALLPRGWALLEILLKHGEAVKQPGDDPMTQAVNSTRGRAIEAAFSHILRSCRLADKETGSHASISAQARHFLDGELDGCRDGNFEFSTLLGAYMGSLEYIDNTWLQQNIGRIFPIDRHDNFACAIGGLAFASASRRNYVMLRDAGVIDAALRRDARGRDTRQKLMERVALGYLWGEEALDSSRFRFLFEATGSAADLEQLNFFFWTIRGEELKTDQVERILAYWRLCLEWAYAQPHIPVKVMSSLSRLATFLPDATDRNRDLLLAVTPHVHIHHSAYEFLKELDRLLTVSPEGIRDVLARFIETHEPFYDYKDRMQGLVSRLADLGFRADAIRFCENLRSMPGLRDLFMKLTSEGPATGRTTA